MILAALVVAFAQTDWARDIMRREVLRIVNEQLDGTITCDDLHVDIFRGIVLHHPVLVANGTTVLEADELSLTYDIAALFTKTISVNELALRRPRIAILRSRDGVWNINKITRPSVDTTSTPPPDLVVRVRQITVDNGSLAIHDSSTVSSDTVHLDLLHTNIENLNLDASVWLGLRTNAYSASIDACSFRERRANGLDVRELRLAAHVKPTGLDLQFLQLRTAGSLINLAAKLEGVDILKNGLSSDVLSAHPILATVQAERVSGSEVSYVVPEIEVVDEYALDARVAFRGEGLDIDDIVLRAGSGIVRGSVYMREMSGDRGPRLDIRVVNSEAQYADVRRRLVFVPLPELPFLTTTRIDTVTLTGYPADSLFFVVHGSDAPGRVDGRMTLRLDDPAFGYDVDMLVSRGDLSVFSDSSVATDLHGRVVLQGRGTDLQTLNGLYHVDLHRSHALGRPIRSLSLNITADGTGVIDIDSSYVDVTPFRTDTIIEDVTSYDDQTVDIRGRWNVVDAAKPRYSLRLGMNAINLATLLRNPSFPTRLTTGIDIDAEGIHLDSIVGSVAARVDEFSLADRALRPFQLRVTSEREGRRRSWTATSQFLQASVEGTFVPSAFIEVIGASVVNALHAVDHQFRHITDDIGQAQARGVRAHELDATFRVALRDATPVNLFLDSMSMIASLSVDGRVQSTVDRIRVDVDTIDVREFVLVAPDLRISVDPLRASFDCVVSDLTTTPRVEKLDLRAECDNVIRVNDTRIESSQMSISTVDTKSTIRGRAVVNDM